MKTEKIFAAIGVVLISSTVIFLLLSIFHPTKTFRVQQGAFITCSYWMPGWTGLGSVSFSEPTVKDVIAAASLPDTETMTLKCMDKDFQFWWFYTYVVVEFIAVLVFYIFLFRFLFDTFIKKQKLSNRISFIILSVILFPVYFIFLTPIFAISTLFLTSILGSVF